MNDQVWLYRIPNSFKAKIGVSFLFFFLFAGTGVVLRLSVLIFSFSVPDLIKYYEAQVLKISGESFARYAGPPICRNNHLIPNKVYIEHHKISKLKISNMYHETFWRVLLFNAQPCRTELHFYLLRFTFVKNRTFSVVVPERVDQSSLFSNLLKYGHKYCNVRNLKKVRVDVDLRYSSSHLM